MGDSGTLSPRSAHRGPWGQRGRDQGVRRLYQQYFGIKRHE